MSVFNFFLTAVSLTIVTSTSPHEVYNSTLMERGLFYAYAAYCPVEQLEAWMCNFCEHEPSFEIYDVNGRGGYQWYVGYDPVMDEVILSFRGSSNVANWIDNLQFWLMDYPDAPEELDCEVHTGFYREGWQENLQNDVLQVIDNVLNDKAGDDTIILVTGHSLGGALSQIAAMDIQRAYPERLVVVYPYASPRIGDQDLVDYYHSLISINWRVVYRLDIVTKLPYSWFGFAHTNPIVWYKDETAVVICNDSENDANCTYDARHILEHLDYLGLSNDCYNQSESSGDMIVVRHLMNWNEAQEYCETEFGTHLVTITDDVQNSEAVLLCFDGGNIEDECWIGLTSQEDYNGDAGYDVFVWVDGTPVNYTNWEPYAVQFDGLECAHLQWSDNWLTDNREKWDHAYCDGWLSTDRFPLCKLNTADPTVAPTPMPTGAPTHDPTHQPTSNPSVPTAMPTGFPSVSPTVDPTATPTLAPTSMPTGTPTHDPTHQPTSNPSVPTAMPTGFPSVNPTDHPTATPTAVTSMPTNDPTHIPTYGPTTHPSGHPTFPNPSANPSHFPSDMPSSEPSSDPTDKPTAIPTAAPTNSSSAQVTTTELEEFTTEASDAGDDETETAIAHLTAANYAVVLFLCCVYALYAW